MMSPSRHIWYIRRGNLPSTCPTLFGHFWANVEQIESCWLWRGSRRPNGYGRFKFHNTLYSAHRFSYELLVGRIPSGLVIDHLCRRTDCVNPSHMETVTMGENTRRGMGPAAIAVRSGLCKRGHVLDPPESFVRRDGQGFRLRWCRICAASSARTKRLARKAGLA